MENRTQKLMEIIEQTKVILIRSKLEYCFKFFSKFTPTEAEIIYFISRQKELTFKGSYVDLSDALGRERGTGASTLSYVRKSVLKLANKGFITLEIKELSNIKKVVSMAISEDFMDLLNAEDIGVENLRAKKVCT